jgi:DNA invertase Pin-like site-specific DNA recombinase
VTRDEELATIDATVRSGERYQKITQEMVQARDEQLLIDGHHIMRRHFVSRFHRALSLGRRGRGERFTPEQKAQALEMLAAGEGYDEVALKTKCSRQTLHRWHVANRGTG